MVGLGVSAEYADPNWFSVNLDTVGEFILGPKRVTSTVQQTLLPMSLQSQTIASIPAQTRQVAQAAFPQGNRYMQLRDTLGILYEDELFADLVSHRGSPLKLPAN